MDSEHPSELQTRARLVTETCLLQSLRASARAVTTHYESHLAPTGLTASQFSTLAAIAAHGGATLSQFATALGMDRTTLTRVLAPLERRGLVATAQSTGDARERRLTLTSAGQNLLGEALAHWQKAQAEVVTQLGPQAHAADLRHALKRLG